ncbi:MAG: hypothetical protein HWQ38_12385 [Nostoc sp. NMS7]|uniref:hypothetical protein n=1 Tax=Nostoc sp. NMS7 TaxID=2815391 RepID=UPI0025E4FF64|nr:hypothetical protein [Nostoc sp. NMS7]MBN3947221.1 hypothetical protein [Nostoc sp. NMS7]
MIIELNEKLFELHDKFPFFGIILFTDAHPHIIKTLKDEDYYSALNEISGSSIAVFATLLFTGAYKFPQIPKGALGQMIPVWKEPNENLKILSWFDINDSRNLPTFILFTVEGNQLFYQSYNIRANSNEQVFNCLKQILEFVPQNFTNDNLDKKEIFTQLEWKIKKLKTTEKIKEILGIISLFRGSIGI